MDEDIKINIKKYIELDDKMKELRKEISKIKEEQEDYKDKILEYMQDNEIPYIPTSKGKLKYKKYNIQSKLDEQHVATTLSNLIKDVDIVNKATVSIFENREKTEKITLQRVKH